MPRHLSLERRPKSTRIRACLAGALVLGVGATVTLASWNDSEYATGTFTASTFDTQSSTVAGVWASNATSPGAAFVFTPSASSMSPGVSQYGWVNIRTTASTTVGGTEVLTSATPTGLLAPVLEYRVVRIAAAATCDATAFSGSPTYIAGGAASYLAVSTVPGAAVPTTLGAASAGETRFCFDVRIQNGAANTNQGTTATVTWLFTGTSN